MSAPPLIAASDLPPGHAGLLVGLSGGLDSMVLLHALASLPEARVRGLRAIHVHHGLQPQADDWQRHCEAACDALRLPLRCVRVKVLRDTGEGLEAAARHARHAAFAEDLGNDEVLALAHHRGDQAETFLLRALRGSGVDGLAAMRPWRRYGRGWLWRPLLDRGRDALEAYAWEHALRWIEDPGNEDLRFDRNYLRRRVLPLLRERWPHADASLAASAVLCMDAGGLLATEDAAILARVRTADPQVLSRDALRTLPVERRARVLRRWIGALGLPPLPAEGVARIEADVLPARADAGAGFAWRNANIRAWRDLLHAGVLCPPLPPEWRVEWDGTMPLPLPDGARLELVGNARFDASVAVHARQGGERIVLHGRDHSHALKQVLQDLGVPPWVRERLPLLSDARGELLAAGDLVFSASFEAWLRDHSASLRWLTQERLAPSRPQ